MKSCARSGGWASPALVAPAGARREVREQRRSFGAGRVCVARDGTEAAGGAPGHTARRPSEAHCPSGGIGSPFVKRYTSRYSQYRALSVASWESVPPPS